MEHPQTLGLKQARQYLADEMPSTKEYFLQEGRKRSAHPRYLEGWERAWDTELVPTLYPKNYGQANYPSSLEDEIEDRLKK